MCSNVKVCGPTKIKVCNKSNESYKTALPVLMFLSQFFPSRTFGKLIFLPSNFKLRESYGLSNFPLQSRSGQTESVMGGRDKQIIILVNLDSAVVENMCDKSSCFNSHHLTTLDLCT